MAVLESSAAPSTEPPRVRIAEGVLEGVNTADESVACFLGIPYAAPPVGPLRWKAPRPPAPWAGVRRADAFGPRAMQAVVYLDMKFRDAGPSEDCLYLNVWAPANRGDARLPVMVWIHGGGFIAGSSSEPRQDGANLAKRGVIVVSFNYRLGIFGFLAYPGLAAESDGQSSGNYGLLDQVAALRWVRDNIAAFGGDPGNVTLFGESAGSFSICALMVSPIAQGLFRRAIGESGAFFQSSLFPLRSRAEAERRGVVFVQSVLGGASIAALRDRPAGELLQAAQGKPRFYFSPCIDGFFLPESCESAYAGSRQSHVALLGGWNRDDDDSEISVPTRTWLEAQRDTGASPVYAYEFDQVRPAPQGSDPREKPTVPHASEIEYVFGNLTARDVPWRPDDRTVSELMGSYWTNFAKTGDPNGSGLPPWPSSSSGAAELQLLRINAALFPTGRSFSQTAR